MLNNGSTYSAALSVEPPIPPRPACGLQPRNIRNNVHMLSTQCGNQRKKKPTLSHVIHTKRRAYPSPRNR